MDSFSRDIGDDQDLDELMSRVREAALGASAGASAAAAAVHADTAGGDPDLIKVIEAQSQLNEHMRKTLAELVECLQTLREDWGETHTALRHEMARLSALVGKPRTSPRAAVVARARPSSAAARDGRTMASRRAGRRQATKGGKKRS